MKRSSMIWPVRMLTLGALLLSACATTHSDYWGDWSSAESPEAVGRRVARNLLPRPVPATQPSVSPSATRPATQPALAGGPREGGFRRGEGFGSGRGRFRPGGMGESAATGPASQPGFGPATRPRRPTFNYPEICTAYGALRLAGELKDQALRDKLVSRYARLLTPEGRELIPAPTNVDRSVTGILPMEIFRQTGDRRYLELGLTSADAQFQALNEAGLTRQTRFWIDDMFMITALQTQAYRVTKDPVYLDRAAMEMVAYLERLQQPNGLFHHGLQAPFFWGRGNGWVAAGMAELLLELPESHPQRERIMDGYRKMMAGLLAHQGHDGMWHQLIDHEESYPETSSTGMFTFAMAVGVRNGWLEAAPYKEPTRKAWLALARFVDEKGNVRDVCVGTNQTSDIHFYFNRPKASGDLHGQAAVLWAAWAMGR